MIRNNIFILGIYMGDLLYCAYSRSSLKPCFSFLLSSFLLNLSLLHYLFSFTVFGNVPLFVVFKTHSCFLFLLLCSTFLCHMFVLVAIEALRLPIFEIVVGLLNIHLLSSSPICHSSAHFVTVSSFCRLISLSY